MAMTMEQPQLVREVETAVSGGAGGRLLAALSALAMVAALVALGYLLVEAVSLHETRAASYLATVALFAAGLISPSPLQLGRRS
ncbi:MAG TPA: hypothetical protein VNL35_06725 [Chloroflexota bacterium]|nr:hypothetical protein [Chloroflexota bacterium]